MAIRFSPIVASQARGAARSSFSVKALDLAPLRDLQAPVLVCDDFRVSGRPFPPHPHAGFAAVTYVFADSAGGLRSRDSLGTDVVVGAGGVVWTHAGQGVIHHEIPAGDAELHGLQLFVNLAALTKQTEPRTMSLLGSEVPEWTGEAGDRVRVVVGSFQEITSPLTPVDPFRLLDVALQRALTFEHLPGHVTLVYVVSGDLGIGSEDDARHVVCGQAIALHGGGGFVNLAAIAPSHVVIMSGAEIREPVVIDGPFIMTDPEQIAAARARYASGRMGRLASL
jgi:redox-sensitive bicupin YhaK (pirin superfamily)